MKLVGFVLMSMIISHSVYSNDTVTNCREYYYGVCLNKESIHDFQEYLELHNENIGTSVKGYKSAIWFLWADYFINPLKKWTCFNNGKDELEKLIKNNPNNIELRFLRLTIQDNLPNFLRYNQDKKIDKEFIHNRLNQIVDEDLRMRIITYLCYNSMAKIK